MRSSFNSLLAFSSKRAIPAANKSSRRAIGLSRVVKEAHGQSMVGAMLSDVRAGCVVRRAWGMRLPLASIVVCGGMGLLDVHNCRRAGLCGLCGLGALASASSKITCRARLL